VGQSRTTGRHHGLEILKGNRVTIVGVDALYHLLALLEAAHFSQVLQNTIQLINTDPPIVVQVVHLERALQVSRHMLVVHVLRVRRHKLLKADEAVLVGVRLFHHAIDLLLRSPALEGAHHGAQLRSRYFPVAVAVELAEHFFQVTAAGQGRRRRSRVGGGRRFGGSSG